MKQAVTFFIALRYIRAKRRNHFISFISLVSAIGLLLGVAVLILVLSVMNGAHKELQTRILGMVPHAVLQTTDGVQNWQALSKDIEQYGSVVASAPFIQIQGMLSSKGQVAGAFVHGIEPSKESGVSILPAFMKYGFLEDLRAGDFGIVMGSYLAAQLNLRIGDKVTLVIPEANISPAGIIPRFKRFTLVGVFEVGAELDAQYAYIHLADAAKLMRLKGATGLRIKVDDLFQAPALSRQIANDYLDLIPYDWTFSHGTLFQAIKMEKTMMALLLFLIVAVAAFNIVSSLIMLVTDKKPDIAILQTMGATSRQIRRIFMFQGMIIGCVGIALGAALGVIMALTISDFFGWIEKVLGVELFAAYFINYLPSELDWGDVAMVVCVAFGMSFFATLYPATRASKIQPVEALRYE